MSIPADSDPLSALKRLHSFVDFVVSMPVEPVLACPFEARDSLETAPALPHLITVFVSRIDAEPLQVPHGLRVE